MTILSVQNLTKTFYMRTWPLGPKISFTAVNGISFELKEGEILGFLGPNGAGKTTTIQMLLAILTPTSGKISYFGKDLSMHRTEILKKVSYASAYVKMPSRLSIEENLDIFARLYSMSAKLRAQRIDHFLKLFNLSHLRKREVGTLSAGQMARVNLAKAFIPQPRILLLDEPTASLDPDAAQDVRDLILEHQAQERMSVLFTSHNMDEVTQLCDRVLILQDGSIIADSAPMELAASVSSAHVQLTMVDGLKRTAAYAQTHGLAYELWQRSITIEIDEHQIASMLADLAQEGVEYSQISIEKPTLEDYFLSIARAGKKQD